MKAKLFTAILLFSVSISFAQYDWTSGKLILKNGEILKGLIKIPTPSKNLIGFSSSKLQYKKDKKSKKQKFGSDKVSKVFFNTFSSDIGYYEYVPIGRKKMSLYKLIRNGKVKLYVRTIFIKDMSRGELNGQVKKYKDYALIRNTENTVTSVESNYDSVFFKKEMLRLFNNTLLKYFSDCETIVEYIENDLYYDFDLVQIVEDYNLFCE